MSIQSEMDNIAQILIDGLVTDGAHHKQWYLEEALKRLVGPTNFKEMRRDVDGEEFWEPGVEP